MRTRPRSPPLGCVSTNKTTLDLPLGPWRREPLGPAGRMEATVGCRVSGMGGRGAELTVEAGGSIYCSYAYFRYLAQGRWSPDGGEHQVYTFLQRVTEAELAGAGDAWAEMAYSKINKNYIIARGNGEPEVATCTGGAGGSGSSAGRGGRRGRSLLVEGGKSGGLLRQAREDVEGEEDDDDVTSSENDSEEDGRAGDASRRDKGMAEDQTLMTINFDGRYGDEALQEWVFRKAGMRKGKGGIILAQDLRLDQDGLTRLKISSGLREGNGCRARG